MMDPGGIPTGMMRMAKVALTLKADDRSIQGLSILSQIVPVIPESETRAEKPNARNLGFQQMLKNNGLRKWKRLR
jgi:hypothetical protein